MQDTPNFNNLKAQFNQYGLADLIDARETVQEPYRTTIKNAYGKVESYFVDDAYRATLNPTRKANIEAQITNILGQFQTLRDWQVNGTVIAGTNIENVQNSLFSYLEDFDMRYSTPHQLYTLQNNANVDEIIKNAEETQAKIQEVYGSVNKVLDDAKKLTGTAASNRLANYYQDLANGLTVKENAEAKQGQRKPYGNTIKPIWYLISAVLLFIGAHQVVSWYKEKVLSLRTVLEAATAIVLPLLVFSILRLMNWINRKYRGGYARTAILWMLGAIGSTIVTAIYASLLVFELGNSSGWDAIVPKIIGLLAPAYFVRFCVQNYRANMHLAIQNTHRATVATIVRPYSDLVTHENPTFEQDVLTAKINIIHAAAQILFEQSESGYLTTKEGAGGSDNMLDGLGKLSK